MLFSLFASRFLVWIYFELYRELLNAAAYEHIHVHDLQQRTILLLYRASGFVHRLLNLLL